MQIEKYLIAFVIFGLVVGAGFLIMTDVNTNYGTNLSDTDFNSGNYSLIVSKMGDISGNIKDQSLPNTVEDENFLITIVKGAYRAIKQVINTFSIFILMSNNIANVLNIPQIFVQAAYIIMILLVIFALIYLYMKISVS